MGATSSAKVPYFNGSTLIARDELSLIWMNNTVVYWGLMVKISLWLLWSTRVPDFQSAIFGCCYDPFPFVLPCYSGDIARMGIKRSDLSTTINYTFH